MFFDINAAVKRQYGKIRVFKDHKGFLKHFYVLNESLGFWWGVGV